MLKSGLVSVSFRNLEPIDIVQLVKEASLESIEWGGDKHVPHGDFKQAKLVRKLTEDAGLEISSYGSYYYVGCCQSLKFEDVLETARCLNTKTIRVWAGNKKSKQASIKEWDQIVLDGKRIALLAKEQDIDIAFEYHDDTLTDTYHSAIMLMERINLDNALLFWQPPIYLDANTRLNELKAIQSYLSHVHVFHWNLYDRLPLIDGVDDWKKYFQSLPKDGKQRYCSLEFIKGDNLRQFMNDASILRELILDAYK